MKNSTAIENTLKSVFKIAIINIIFGCIALIIITRKLDAFNSTDFTVNLYRYGTLAFIGVNADLLRIAKKAMKEEKAICDNKKTAVTDYETENLL